MHLLLAYGQLEGKLRVEKKKELANRDDSCLSTRYSVTEYDNKKKEEESTAKVKYPNS